MSVGDNYLRKLCRAAKGKRAIVSGLGVSAQALMLRPELPADVTTYGVNDGGTLYAFDYVCVIDKADVIPLHRLTRIACSAPLVLCTDHRIKTLRRERGVETQLVLSRTAKPQGWIPLWEPDRSIDKEPRWLWGWTSPMTAAWLAAYMGNTRVGIVGVDLLPGNVFDPEYRHEHDTEKDRAMTLKCWRWFHAQMETYGVKVINLAPKGGVLDGVLEMEQITMEEFLA